MDLHMDYRTTMKLLLLNTNYYLLPDNYKICFDNIRLTIKFKNKAKSTTISQQS